MLIFLDESGDTGFKFNKGSSRYFVVTLVIFQGFLEAEETSLIIKKLRRKIKVSDYFEFKFSKTKNAFREAFLSEVRRGKFQYQALVIDKEKFSHPLIQKSQENFYQFVIKEALRTETQAIQKATLYLDKKAAKTFAQTVNTYLRKELNQPQFRIIKKFKHRDSKSNTLLQLADMISGTIFRKFEKSDDRFYKIIRKKEGKLVFLQ